MRAYVLRDARLAKLAGRVVRLDIDTEKPGNAAFVEKFPIDAWPTLLAIDPATGETLCQVHEAPFRGRKRAGHHRDAEQVVSRPAQRACQESGRRVLHERA